MVKNTNTITFGVLRGYLAKCDRLSICSKETLEYHNYICIGDVPSDYDDLYVYGIGMIQSEFYKVSECIYTTAGEREQLEYVSCMEIMLSCEPRQV